MWEYIYPLHHRVIHDAITRFTRREKNRCDNSNKAGTAKRVERHVSSTQADPLVEEIKPIERSTVLPRSKRLKRSPIARV